MLEPAELKEKLRGVIPFAPTPFRRDDLEIDLAGFRNNLDFLVQNGIPWIAVAGFVGEYSAHSPREYAELVGNAADVVKGKANLIAGVGGGTQLAREAARVAQDQGADCVMVLPPYLVEPTPAGIVAHFRTIAHSVEIGVMIHSMPGMAFAPELIEKVAETPNVVSYKDETGDLRMFDETVSRIGRRLVYVNGKAEMMLPYYFSAGATCSGTAIGNFDPLLALAACQAAQDADYGRVRELLSPKARPWYRLREKNRAYLISLTKASMELAGLCGGTVRPPLSDVSREDQIQLQSLMEDLGYIQSARTGAVSK
jgi:5-dehydro-4-deoxyglucarate dehydratase